MEPEILKNHIIHRLNGIIPPGLDVVLSNFKRKEINKGDRLIDFNEICQSVFFIEKGLVQIIYYDDNDNLWTRDIVCKNEWCANLESFENQTPSKEEYICLEKSVLWSLDRTSFNEMLKFAPQFGEIYRQILSELYFESIKQNQVIISKSAEQRIYWLYSEKQYIAKKLSAKILANYLHLNKDVFGRLRKNVLKGLK